MSIVRYAGADGRPEVGVRENDRVHPIAGADLASLLRLSEGELRQQLGAAAAGESLPRSELTLLAPIDGRTEVWGAGVTYIRSREARMEESKFDRVYLDVYDADRPELFFKPVAGGCSAMGREAGCGTTRRTPSPNPRWPSSSTAQPRSSGR